jgi:hypothetical protein
MEMRWAHGDPWWRWRLLFWTKDPGAAIMTVQGRVCFPARAPVLAVISARHPTLQGCQGLRGHQEIQDIQGEGCSQAQFLDRHSTLTTLHCRPQHDGILATTAMSRQFEEAFKPDASGLNETAPPPAPPLPGGTKVLCMYGADHVLRWKNIVLHSVVAAGTASENFCGLPTLPCPPNTSSLVLATSTGCPPPILPGCPA